MRPELFMSEVQIKTPSLFKGIPSPHRQRSLSAGPSSSSISTLASPPSSPQSTSPTMVDAGTDAPMDTFVYARPRPKPSVTIEPGPQPSTRTVGVQAEPEVLPAPAPAPACTHAPVEHKVVIEIRHIMPPPVVAPTGAAVVPPPAPLPVPEPPAATWYGRAWQRAKPPVMWVGWALMQLLAVVNVPLILNFGRGR